MADALVSATILVTLEATLSLATDRIASLICFKDDWATMTRCLLHIHAILFDAEERQGQDLAVQQWLKNLEGVAFDAYNVFDELKYCFLRLKVKSRIHHKRKVCFFFSFSNFRWRMASKVRDIKEKLIKINREARELGLCYMLAMIDAFPAAAGDTTSGQTDSLVAPMIGRDNDKSKIVEMLLSPSKKVVSVIPVVGMGGIGKTTLAKSIYNNEHMDRHFDKKIWVCVSRPVHIVKLFELILVQLTGKKVEVDDRNVIVEEIGKQLRGKRYFLVLDDVWNHEQEFWDDFFITLKGLNPINGSRCLITTRLEQLARTVSSFLMMDVEPYYLGRLPDSDCWSILKEKAIGRDEEPEELKAISYRVTKRCNGLPLAARVIGGLLRLSAKDEWSLMVEKSHLRDDQSGVGQILKVSFDYLSPAPIKKCFAYCSIFPKDTEMGRDSLIELWMAEGFLQPNLKSKTVMEKIGDKYLRVLVQSSLFEEIIDHLGVRYKMHDLVHDLAESVSESDSINLETGVIDNNFQVRYLAANSIGENFENTSTSVRTLFLECGISGEMLSKFKNLHVLNLSGRETCELPTTINKLIHLRYIDLTSSNIQALPESLCKLYNLQTLRLIGCNHLKGLPKGMNNLISLRHLHYYTDDASFQMPVEMGHLSSLQTLEFFNVGEEKGCQIEELGSLKDLKGKLVIRNLHLVNGKEGAEGANLSAKENLLKLELIWASSREGANLDGDALEGLQPHPNLQELVIENFMGDQFPRWFMHLSILVVLELKDCKRCRELPAALGRLPSLQHLILLRLESIRCIFYGVDNRSSSSVVPTTLFPALKTLKLDSMPKLEGWMEAYVFPCLENLTIQYCPRLTSIPSQFPVLKTLKLNSMPKFEGWMEVSPTIEMFPCLENITIQYCPRLTSIPSHFPAIKELKILTPLIVKDSMPLATICSSVTTLVELCIHSISKITCFPGDLLFRNRNLEILHISSCSNLTQVVPSLKDPGTSLRELSIHGCEKLVELPQGLDNLSCLELLSVEECPNLISFPDYRFTFLRHLKIAYCDQLSHLPLGMIEFATELRSLRISHCPSLSSLPLHLDNKTLLSSLWISNCPKWTSVPEELKHVYLSCLRELRIGCFSDPVQFDSFRECIPNLGELHTVGLCGHPKWTKLPDDLQYLQALRLLFLSDFGIEVLPEWLGKLSSLEELGLYKCKKLKDMPSDEAMKCLTNLTRLSIFGCPLVKKRCMQHYGPGSGWSTPKFELNTD